MWLTVHHTIQSLNDPEDRRLLKNIVGKEKNAISHGIFKPISDRNHHLSYV